MMGSGFLLARPRSRSAVEFEEVNDYTRFEFGGDAAWIRNNESSVARNSRIDLNGGRSGWMAEARHAVAKAAVILLPSPSPRGSAGRRAPEILAISGDAIGHPGCPEASRD